MAAKSFRNLVAGSGTVSMTSGSKVLTFSQSQSFKEGAVVSCANGQFFTIDVGSGTTWTAMQAAGVTASGQTFNTTDTSTSRARGSGVIVPNARVHLYYADRDSSGNPDWFFYADHVFPENGVHPYTKDWYAGPSVRSSRTVQYVVPDPLTRIRLIEGSLRGALGDLSNPDSRLDSLETSLVPVGATVPYGGRRAPIGWLLCDGASYSRTTYAALFATLVDSATVTISIASPGVVTWNNHPLVNDDPIKFTTTGTLPTGITAGTTYYVVSASTNTFQIAATPGGTAINTSGTQSGTHTAICAPYGDGDGSTTFNVPDLRGRVELGAGAGSGLTRRARGQKGGEENHTLTVTEIPAHIHNVSSSSFGDGTASAHGTNDSPDSAFQSGSNGGSGAHNNMQPWLGLNFIIKATVNLDGNQGPYTMAQLLSFGESAV